jgi:hypothetical protein
MSQRTDWVDYCKAYGIHLFSRVIYDEAEALPNAEVLLQNN